VHIEARVAQVREIEAQVAAERDTVRSHAAAQHEALSGRVWLPAALRERLAQRCTQAMAVLDALARRLAAAREGFAALPCDATATAAAAPEPVALEAAA
jgi:hypothetical protein